MQMSMFRPISIGMAAENLKLGETELEVWPIELLPTMEGELTPDKLTLDTAGVDGNGKEYNASVEVGATIKAKWLGGGNRITAPNIRRGERVEIYEMGDSNTYYWRSYGMDQNLRRLETVIYAFNANPKNDDQDAPSPDNSYFFEINTHSKLVTFRTTMLNQEKAAFTVQFDLGEGKFTFEDEKGNVAFFDSVNTHFRMENVDKTFIDIMKKAISIFAEDTIKVETNALTVLAKNTIDVTTKVTNFTSSDSFTLKTKAATIEAGDSIDIKTTSTTMESSASIDIKTGMFNMDAGSAATIKAGVITLDGPVMGTGPGTFAGPVAAAALAAGGGAGGVSGGGAMTGSSSAMSGPISCAGIQSSGPGMFAGPLDGNPTTSGNAPLMPA